MADEKGRVSAAGALPEPTDVQCPSCKKGFLAPTQGKYGLYYTCNAAATPKCRFSVPTKPTGHTCKFRRGATADAVCGALMVEGTKTIPERCSDKACPNRNPHKM